MLHVYMHTAGDHTATRDVGLRSISSGSDEQQVVLTTANNRVDPQR